MPPPLSPPGGRYRAIIPSSAFCWPSVSPVLFIIFSLCLLSVRFDHVYVLFMMSVVGNVVRLLLYHVCLLMCSFFYCRLFSFLLYRHCCLYLLLLSGIYFLMCCQESVEFFFGLFPMCFGTTSLGNGNETNKITLKGAFIPVNHYFT